MPRWQMGAAEVQAGKQRSAGRSPCQTEATALSLLDHAIYSYADVDRLVGLQPGTALRWLEGYTRQGRFYEPILREGRSGSDVVTWGEMVEARLLAEYRRQRVTVQRMRPAIVRLREEFGGYPLAQARPFLDVEGRELVRVVQDQVRLERELQLVVVRSGRLMLADPTRRFAEAVDYVDGVASSIRVHAGAPGVVMDPMRAFGQPAVRSVRTDSLAEEFRAGSSYEELADVYDLTTEEVQAAIRFELIAGHETAA